MTDRKKLIEAISGSGILCEICGESTMTYCAEALADHLLANGVTFAADANVGDKWRPASEPPEVWRDKKGTMINYLVYMPEYGVDVGNYMKPAKLWLCVGLPVKVTHWMPMPKQPKEV